VRLNFEVSINGVIINVADYYLPIERAEYIWSYSHLSFVPEHFGAASHILSISKEYDSDE
jgi:hypothetical protein